MDDDLLLIILAVTTAILVLLIFFLRIRHQQRIITLNKLFHDSEKELEAKKVDAEKNMLIWIERFKALSGEHEAVRSELDNIRKENINLTGQVEKEKTVNLNLIEKLQSQKAELDEIQKKFTMEFENIAGKILKKNSEEFTLANQKNIGDVLNPLKEKINLFEKKVEDTYQKGLKDQTDLRAELKKLYELNNRISEEAGNLTRALKGDVKKQGNWGEVVLERILERSGLNEGENGYQIQYSDNSAEGKRIQPDVVVNLPDNKHIIIDSKVSLIAYERAVNAVNDDDRAKYVKDHLISLKAHIKGLSEKHYQTASRLNSPDFVLLFIPVEASFSLAIREDQELFSYAWDQKVVIVSPSTLLATLRTIASIWQQENQTRNAMEIAKQGGALYDKFVNFIADMEKLGNNLRLSQNSYKDAMSKLSEGRGNLVRSTEKLKELGAKASKQISQNLLD
jgi:DNA recombination protein RmuC